MGAVRQHHVGQISALGAVAGFDDWAPTLMTEIPMGELAAELTATVSDILGLPDLATPAAAPAVAQVAD